MSYQEGEQVKIKRQSSKQAITLAMEGRWKEAITENKNLIESFPDDVDAYNRLGRAYMELGDYSQAREAYGRAVELDPYNNIAKKNLNRLSHLGESITGLEKDSRKVDPQHFIEETGKAGVVNLYRLGQPGTLAKMAAGDEVYLKINGSNLAVENAKGEYLGQVEPKHGQRLIRLISGGNRYTATVISSTIDMINIIIREVYQDPSQSGRLSFPLKGFESFHPYISDKIFRRELEYDDELEEEPSYTIVGRDETEWLSERSPDEGGVDNQ